MLSLAGCLKKPCLDPLPPEIIIIEPEYKIYPIEPLEPLEQITIYPLDEPNIIGGIKENDVKAIQRNTIRVVKWGITNQTTIEVINNQAIEHNKEKGTGE